MSDRDELTRIIRDLRGRAEVVELLIQEPHTSDGRLPMSDRRRLSADGTLQRLLDGASDLAASVEELQHWLDDNGPDDLKNPYAVGEWHAYAPLRERRRSWWRRLAS